jgi:hypothetical protein
VGKGFFCVFPVLFRFGFGFVIIWVALSLVGGLFVSLLCIQQTDLKSFIDYSSVAHMSMVICGFVSQGGRIVDVVLEWEWELNLGLRLGGEGLLTPTNNSFVEQWSLLGVDIVTTLQGRGLRQ